MKHLNHPLNEINNTISITKGCGIGITTPDAHAGVTMTLFCRHGRVSDPNSLLDHEVIAPCGYSVPCQF